jgi:hypothetical protein
MASNRQYANTPSLGAWVRNVALYSGGCYLDRRQNDAAPGVSAAQYDAPKNTAMVDGGMPEMIGMAGMIGGGGSGGLVADSTWRRLLCRQWRRSLADPCPSQDTGRVRCREREREWSGGDAVWDKEPSRAPMSAGMRGGEITSPASASSGITAVS